MEISLPFLVGLVLLLGGVYAWWQFMERRLSVITPGEVYTSAAMPPEKLRGMARRLGLRTVFDLRGPGEGADAIRAEAEALEAEGVAHVNLDSPQVPTDDLRDRFLDWIANPAHRPALMHCNHGEGRAVLYGALWRIECEGMDPERARKRCRLLTTRGSSFDPRKPKGAYLRSYTRRRT